MTEIEKIAQQWCSANGQKGRGAAFLAGFEFAKQEPEWINAELKEEIRVLKEVNQSAYESVKLAEQALETEAIKMDGARLLMQECQLQLEYLSNKFKETGTSNAVINKIESFLIKSL